MNYQDASISELITARDIAYINGGVLYDVLSALVIAREDQEEAQIELCDKTDELIALEKSTVDFALYRDFFDECFERLDGHYPCPSITSDYDQSVIFDAISGIE